MNLSVRAASGRVAGMIAMACALGACAAAPEPQPVHHTIRVMTRTPTATATPRPPIDEAPVDEGPAAEATPAQPGFASLPPSDGAASTTSEPASMLTRINPSTPPNVAAAYRLIEEARRFLAHGDVAQATHRLERSVAIDPMNPYGYYFLAQVHLQSRAYDQAIGFAGRAAALSARSDRLGESRAFSLQGIAYEQAGRFADARTSYTKALQSDPHNSDARLGFARLSGH